MINSHKINAKRKLRKRSHILVSILVFSLILSTGFVFYKFNEAWTLASEETQPTFVAHPIKEAFWVVPIQFIIFFATIIAIIIIEIKRSKI